MSWRIRTLRGQRPLRNASCECSFEMTSAWTDGLGVPLILGVVYVLARTTVPFDVLLSLSRDGMNQAAVEIMARGSTDRSWIGLYPIGRVEWIPNGMRFTVASYRQARKQSDGAPESELAVFGPRWILVLGQSLVCG